MRVLFVIPALTFGGAARQLTLLAAGLPADSFTRLVCVLGQADDEAEELCAAGVDVEVCGWRHLLDPAPALRLRQTLREFQPDVVHAWQLPAARLVALLPGSQLDRLLVSWPFRLGHRTGKLNWLDRRFLARCAGMIFPSNAEAERCRALGLPVERVVTVPPGVVVERQAAPPRAEARRTLHLPEAARLVAAFGPLEAQRGLRDAVWALDILRGLYPDLHLVLIGPGPDRPTLAQFARAIHAEANVHFVEEPTDIPGLLAQTEMVWVPDRLAASLDAVLLAMAAGRPVVAAHVPGMAEVVREDETGLLHRPGDKAELARQARRLLEDTALRQRLGEAGRRRAETEFAATAMVRRFADLYAACGAKRK